MNTSIGPGTARYAVLGESLGHTWSPYIHNTIFARAGRDAVYLPITIGRDKLASALDVLESCFGGFNVTIPYKERIIPLLDGVSDAARACGAVNTVKNENGRLVGDITDGLGMIRALEEGGVTTRQIDALILGGGGAARATAYAFLERGGRVTFAVRDKAKGEKLANDLAASQRDGRARLSVQSLDGISGAHDVLVNCTPVGMHPRVDACPVDDKTVARCGAVFDAVYNPRKTRLLEMADRLGKPAVEGLGMLFYQAVEAENVWFGGTGVSREAEREVYDELRAAFL